MDGRNAIITGGSKGLGKAMAIEFSKSGASVAIVSRGQEALDAAKAEIAEVSDGKVVAVAADIRQANECMRAVAEAEAALGGIDILVVSRAAGMALMKVLANEGAPHNVLVNGMLVGKIRSDQWEQRHAKDPDGLSLEDWYTETGKEQPMGRLGLAQEFANMACFLASDAGSYINGAAINVDGGLCKVV